MYVDQTDPDATQVVTRGDARGTWVGEIIRNTSLDKLPQ
ncbi:MAG: sugar transferase [Rhodobacteraceae bacterium]|nr:sugar transferase [Paracoccaceae bacterium]